MEQLEILANYIMFEIEGEPSQDEGAGSCAVRLLKQYRTELAECQQQRDRLAEALEVYANPDNWSSEATAYDMETGVFPNADGVSPTVDVSLELGIDIVWCWDDEGCQVAQKALTELNK